MSKRSALKKRIKNLLLSKVTFLKKVITNGVCDKYTTKVNGKIIEIYENGITYVDDIKIFRSKLLYYQIIKMRRSNKLMLIYDDLQFDHNKSGSLSIASCSGESGSLSIVSCSGKEMEISERVSQK